MLRSLTLTFILILGFLTVPARAARPSLGAPDLRCGGYCLYLSLKALGFPVADYQELEESLGQPSNLGYSMDQLAEAAQANGAHTLGVATSLDNLRRRPGRFACIALLKEGHFINLYDVDHRQVYLIDPPTKRTVQADVFEGLWTGKALLISDEPLLPESALPSFRRWRKASAEFSNSRW